MRSTVDNANDIFVACLMADVQKARDFTTSERLADAMKSAGVVGRPEVYLLTPDR